MIDLHTHILPGIDDGVKTEDESVEFARMAVADGVTTIVATPHCKDGFYENRRAAVLEGVARLRVRLERDGVALRLEPGAEVHICPELPERVRDGRAPTLADNGTTLLLELSLSQYPVELENLVFQLRLAGILVLLAHPERIRYFQDDSTRYEALVAQGVWGQITTGSVLGLFGSDVREYSDELLSKGLVHVVASDAHNTRGRPPVLGQAVEAIGAAVGDARARAMALGSPAAFLAGREPELPPVEAARRRRGFLGRFLGR